MSATFGYMIIYVDDVVTTISFYEVALIFPDPHEAYQHAVAQGASPVKQPENKPWGQIVGYVRDLNGCLVELASAMPA